MVRSTLLLFFSSGGPSGADSKIYDSLGMTVEFLQFFEHVIFKVLTFQKSRSNENSNTLSWSIQCASCSKPSREIHRPKHSKMTKNDDSEKNLKISILRISDDLRASPRPFSDISARSCAKQIHDAKHSPLFLQFRRPFGGRS